MQMEWNTIAVKCGVNQLKILLIIRLVPVFSLHVVRMHSMHIRLTESIKANTLHMLNSTKCMPLNDNDDCTHRVLCVCSSAGNEFQFPTTHTISLEVHSMPEILCT